MFAMTCDAINQNSKPFPLSDFGECGEHLFFFYLMQKYALNMLLHNKCFFLVLFILLLCTNYRIWFYLLSTFGWQNKIYECNKVSLYSLHYVDKH